MAGFKEFGDLKARRDVTRPIDEEEEDFAPLGAPRAPSPARLKGSLQGVAKMGHDPTSEGGRVAQRERGFYPRYGAVSGPGGMSYSLQSFDRAGWGNPQWGTPGAPGVGGKRGSFTYPDPRYYTNPMYRPLYDFTEEGGGWMPRDPFKPIKE